VSRIVYVNGRYVQKRDASVHIEDRGYQFADGIYEVCEVNRRDLIDEALHMARLERSLSELRIKSPVAPNVLHFILREIICRNRIENGYIYIQVTRGVAPRDHVFPTELTRPSLIVTARSIDAKKGEANARQGISVATFPDLRWKRVDIKTISLTANVLARQAAKEQGAYEAWLIDSDGMVTEGAASNAWIIDEAGTLITHQADQSILRGVTRTTLLDVIRAESLGVEERRFSLEEAFQAREAFITGATTLVMPVVKIDSRPIGDGAPGPIAQKLRARFHLFAARS
jgi:D-alanine transaminase